MKNKNTVIRKSFIDYEKEQDWINEMCAQGLALVKVGGGLRFEFEPCLPGEYIYRTEIVSLSGKKKQDYFDFSKDAGLEIIAHQWWNLGITYFRKKAADGDFELYTDTQGKIGQIKLFANLYLLIGWVYVASYVVIAINIFLDVFWHVSTLQDAMWAYFLSGSVQSIFNIIFSCLGLIFIPLFLPRGYKLQRKIKKLKQDSIIGE